jgi:putative protease
MFELSTSVSNPQQLRQADWSAYDALYLGDFSCPEYPNNFNSHPELLREGVETVKAQGKKCYLRLYAVPSNHDLPWVRELIEEAMTLPFDAFEVHNMGLLRVLKDMKCSIPIHTGVFANLYTHETAKILKSYGVERVYPNPELSLKEIVYIQENAGIEMLVPVHGKIPLVISETCFLVELSDGDPDDCKFLCSEDYWLKREDWTLKDVGRMTLSGKDLCMIEHVDELLEMGLKNFYVQSRSESVDYVGAVGRKYREAFTRALAGEKVRAASAWVEELRLLATIGLCNGYYFEGAGQKYVGRTPEWSRC